MTTRGLVKCSKTVMMKIASYLARGGSEAGLISTVLTLRGRSFHLA